jgi:hypothetical protein
MSMGGSAGGAGSRSTTCGSLAPGSSDRSSGADDPDDGRVDEAADDGSGAGGVTSTSWTGPWPVALVRPGSSDSARAAVWETAPLASPKANPAAPAWRLAAERAALCREPTMSRGAT